MKEHLCMISSDSQFVKTEKMLKTTKPSLFSLMVTFIAVGMLTGPCNGLYNCYGNFTPCSCNGPAIECEGIPAVTVKSVLSKIQTSYFDALILSLPNVKDSNTLMADLNGNITFGTVSIECLWPTSPLVINANAFRRSTESATQQLFVINCDLSQLNWGFVSNFNLQRLILKGNRNFLTTFYTLPSASLTYLTYLEIVGDTGLNNGFLNLSLRYPEPLKQGLYHLAITNSSGLSDFALNCFLIKWITPYSKNTLQIIDISMNNLTKIPNEIRNYNNLASVYVGNNRQPLTIQKNAFNLKKNALSYNTISFSNSKVTSIQPGAFQGYYGNYRIYLADNQLTTFDEGVFKTIVQQMMSETGFSRVDVFNNPFECSNLKSLCNLAWLVRDNPSYLNGSYKGVHEARCANGTYFKELSAMALRYPICP